MVTKNKNPKDYTWPIFKKLTRLFSGPIINYRSQSTRQLRHRQLNKYGTKFRDLAGQQFQRLSYNPFDNLTSNIMSAQNRNQRYVDFDQMEFTPEIASALDIYADEMTTSNNLRPMLAIKCSNEEIKGILDTLYHSILNIEFNLFGWCRTMCKFGDFFLYIDLHPETGINNVIGLPTPEMERLEGEDKTNPNYIQFQWNVGGLTFENWQMAHFRILGNDKYAPYGTSVLEAARRIWRQLTLLEDAMMAYRIVRSPERRVFKVDVGNIPPEDVEQYMQKVITSLKRNQIVDPDTGRVDLRYNPMSIDEDYFIPVRNGVGTTIEPLPGGQYTGDIDDVKYLRDKLFSALKVPQSYLARGEGGDEDKTTLAQKDIRFARTVQRLQRSIVSELEKLGIIHLYTLGFRGSDLVSFELLLNNPSQIAELQELESWRTKFDVAGSAPVGPTGFFSRRWVYKHIFNLSDEDVLRNQRELFYDAKFDHAIGNVAEMAMAQAQSAAATAADDLGISMPEEPPPEEAAAEGGAPAEMPPEAAEAAAAGAPEEGAPEEESALLVAPPAKRDDGAYLTKGAKGKWYVPVNHDHRTSTAPRQKSFQGQWAGEMASPSRRNLFKGIELLSLGRGISENEDTIYNDEEEKIFNTKYEVKKLIEGLEQNYETKT